MSTPRPNSGVGDKNPCCVRALRGEGVRGGLERGIQRREAGDISPPTHSVSARRTATTATSPPQGNLVQRSCLGDGLKFDET